MRTLDTLLKASKITKADQRSDGLYVVSEEQLKRLVHTVLSEAITKLKVDLVQFADHKLKHLSKSLTEAN